MKKRSCRKKGWKIAVILLCATALIFGIGQKEGYHMDELLSFELANAQFNPWIVPTQPKGRLAKFVENEIKGGSFSETMKNLQDTLQDVLENRGDSKLLSYKADVYEEPVWITAQQFRDYITVSDKDAFQYLSVYFNVKDDNHPPLHFMVLHTISSLFRRRLDPFMGCVINLAALVGVMLLLMELGKMFAAFLGMEDKGWFIGIFAAALYGFSTGAMITVLLIRMYAMLTFFCVTFFYLCMKKWQEREFDKKNLLLIAITVLGFWTQYFFLFYCIVLVLVMGVILWKSKRMQEALCLLRSMVIAAIVGLLTFPFAITDVFSSGRGVEALENLSQGLSGYGERLGAFGKILLDRTFGGFGPALAAMALMCVIWAVAGRVSRGKFPWMLLTIPAAGYFLLAARMSPYLVDRYIMPLFPFVIFTGTLVIARWLWYMEKIWPYRNKIFPGAVLWGTIFLVRLGGLVFYDGTYLYKGYALQEQFAAVNADLPCICIYSGVSYYENLPEFTHYKKTLLVTKEELAQRTEKESIYALEEVSVLIKPGVDQIEVHKIMEETYGFSLIKSAFRGVGAHGDVVLVYEKRRGSDL